MTGAWPVGPSLIGALALAVRDANADPAILHGKRLEYVWRDDGCDRLKSLADFSDIGRFGPIDGHPRRVEEHSANLAHGH